MNTYEDRCGQVWCGLGHVYLVLRKVDHNEYIVLDLETEKTTDFFTNNIDEDEYWKRLY